MVATSSGEGAKKLLEDDHNFDLILCDLMMPEITGMDLHAWLLEHAPALAISMVFMTSGVFTATARTFLAEILNKIIDKPFTPSYIRIFVREFLAS